MTETGPAGSGNRVAVYFYCHPGGPPEKAAYQHNLVCLAEGLDALGVPFTANTNYWRLSPGGDECLLRSRTGLEPEDCSIVVLSSNWFSYRDVDLPSSLFRHGRRYVTVYIDADDGRTTRAWEPRFRPFDLIMRNHFHARHKCPRNFRPWAFGLSRRILSQLESAGSAQSRTRTMLVNFRAEHSLRSLIQRRFLEPASGFLAPDCTVDPADRPPAGATDRMHWEQTGRRHYPAYYQRLLSATASACFAGRLCPAPPLDNSFTRRFNRAYRMLSNILPLPASFCNWDSWRFWESLAAGCVAFHVDLEKYGFRLPVMPENWRHYIGIDLDRIDDALDRLRQCPEILESIGPAGRHWAVGNYGPVATARRFIRITQDLP